MLKLSSPITVDEILPSTHGYLVSVVIENRGKAVAAGSRRDAALFFVSDPRRGELTVRPTGYIEP
jgi:hypothetical protein